jgi:hypothetical protein
MVFEASLEPAFTSAALEYELVSYLKLSRIRNADSLLSRGNGSLVNITYVENPSTGHTTNYIVPIVQSA